MEVASFPVAEKDGQVVTAAESFTEKYATPGWVEQETALAAHGCLNEVSGLPNRAYIQTHLEACMAIWRRHHLSFGVICLRVDQLQRFREIHRAGAIHALLRVVSGTIRHALGASAHVGRWTEDRFLIVIPGYHPYGLTKVAQDLAKIVSRSTIHWWGDVLSVTASWGTADIQEEESPEELIAQAESSLEKMSQRGKEQADAAHG